MYNDYRAFSCPFYNNMPMYTPYGYAMPNWSNNQMYYPEHPKQPIILKDYGPNPFTVDIEEATLQNNTFRTALWTGKHLQLTLMCINVGEDIGLENHPEFDQFLRIEQGQGLVMMGNSKDKLNFQRQVFDNYAIFVPAGTWHNLVNTGCVPIKLYSIYAPPAHPHGTVEKTKQEAEKHH